MEALSTFDLSNYEKVEEALKAIRNPDAFLSADQVFIEGGTVRFGWPDWPEDLCRQLKQQVEALHQKMPLLRPIAAGTEKWNSVIQGWQSDPESAKAVGEALSSFFPGRVRCVSSRRDRRGMIAATCFVQDLGRIGLDLTWKGAFALPTGSISPSDRTALSGAVETLSRWGGRRINPILEQLRGRLTALYGDRFRGLYVFGSYARPDAGIELPESSDLDVALVLSDFESIYKERDRFGDFVADLSLEHGLVISVVPIREADYREGSTNFTRVISEYAIPVK